MRATSATWKALAANGDFTFETKARINGKDYFTISAPKIERQLIGSGFSVGNCNTASLTFSLMTDDTIPPSAQIRILGRLTDGASNNPVYSEWLEFGTFFIDTRDDQSFPGLISFSCFDAMLKVNQPYFRGEIETDWPQPMTFVVNDIASRLGVLLDPRTHIKTGGDYMVRLDTDLSIAQVLGYIGAVHGGNWIITPENKLRLVPVLPTDVTISPALGLYVDDDTVLTDEHEAVILFQAPRMVLSGDPGATEGFDVEAVLGELTTGQTMTVTGVSATDDEDNNYGAGTTDGLVLKLGRNPYATQEICEDLLEDFGGRLYVPYNAQQVIYDPAAELGDVVSIGSRVQSVLCKESLTLDFGFRANILAPSSQEATSEYPYAGSSDALELLRKEVGKDVSSSIKMELDRILLTVESLSGAMSQIDQTVDGITLSVSAPFPDGSGGSYVAITLTVGEHTSTGRVSISGNVDVSGQLSAAALYAAYGDIAKLTVNSLSTSRRIPLYLAGNTNDDNYIEIADKHIYFITASTTGASEQAHNPDGALLYWENDISEAVIGADGYPYIGGSRVFTTTEVTSWPVYVYVYTEDIKRKLDFTLDNNFYSPLDTYGAGYGMAADESRGKGFIQKRTRSFDMWLKTSTGAEHGVFIGDKYTDVIGLRRTVGLDFSGLDTDGNSGTFTETIEGETDEETTITYDVTLVDGVITEIAYPDGTRLPITW